MCSFLEAVPRLVIHHLLQPVFRYLLRLVVVVVSGSGDGGGVDCLLPPLQNRFQKSLASEPDSELVSATRISLIPSSSSVIFFPAIAIDTYNGLLCLHSSAGLAQFRNLMQLTYEHLLQ